MKKVYSMLAIAGIAVLASCGSVSYEKAKSGMLYKIISNSKDSTAKEGDYLKFHFTQKLNDSIVQTSFGKMPAYSKVQTIAGMTYHPTEIFNLLRKGDSVITVLLVDTLLAKGLINQQSMQAMKKGDRIIFTFRILDIFKNDSVFQADQAKEMEKDRPRQMKEQEEQMAKMEKEQKEQRIKDELEMEKSGEAAKGIAAMEAYLKSKNITAQKTGKGTFVAITEQGTGPMADSGKYVTVKYTGRTLEKDSVFDSGTYPLQLGRGLVIAGWDEGLQLFRQGAKGTLYVPGFRAYGKRHPAFKPFQAMIFDVEMLAVSDTMPAQNTQTIPQRRN